ncbi:condensin complex subunit 3-like isoform X2 [Gigantopelta aegis]|uniref:condensin complex subunit 3-like isoform X2 n=1 Tax=Gigantopelta aegis TaxID=1735272 RepID=UPI001B8890D2|nr:condensin complex subunit 3-like isoform X2 [Gigantopelta aegis]
MPELTIRDVFDQCQTGMQGHNKLHTALWKLHDSMPFDDFWKSFLHHLKYSMIVFNREPAVERTLDFVAKFVTSPPTAAPSTNKEDDALTGEQSLLQTMFNFLLENHNACDRAVRFRCCQLINKLLNNLGDDAQIDDDLYDRIYECMLERLRDRIPVVRTQAVFSLSRLQDPTDENCPVIRAYMFLVSRDPNSDVRRAVVSCIAPSIKTLPSLLERTRDVKDSVRQMAYTVLGEKVHIKALSIAQRIQLLRDGLNDRTESVKKTCHSKLLQMWLRVFEGNILELLRSLDVEHSTETCQQVLDTLFENTPVADLICNFDLLDDDKLIPEDKLTCENVMYWRALCENVYKRGVEYEEHLEQILPNCVTFCGYMNKFLEKLSSNYDDLMTRMELEFIGQELLILMKCFDISDQASRKHVEKFLHDMLVSEFVSPSLVEHIIPQLHNVKTNVDDLIGYLAETISEIRQPITTVETGLSQDEMRQIDLKIARIRVEVNQSREELEECVRNQEFERAAELKQTVAELDIERAKLLESAQPQTEEIRTEKDDPVTVHKCLIIICQMLQLLPIKTMSPTLQMLLESQIVPGIQSEVADIRNAAVRGLGLCCLLKQEIVMQHLPLLMQVSQVDTEGVRVTALEAMFDIIHCFGLDVIKGENPMSTDRPEQVENGEQDGDLPSENSVAECSTESEPDVETPSSPSEAAAKLVAILSAFLDSDSSELRTVAAEGLAKLLLSGRVVSSKLVSHLLLLWYNPVTEDDSHLRHCLGAFFPVFAFACRTNQELFEEAFIPTLNTILDAPTSSPLSEINAQNVSDLLIQLVNSKLIIANQNTQDNPGHDNIAVKVCNEILTNPDSFSLKLWTRILNHLDIGTDKTHLQQLKVLCEQILNVVKEKPLLKALNKFQNTIECLLDEGGAKDVTTENPSETTDNNADTSEMNTTAVADLTESEETLSKLATSFTATRAIKKSRAKSVKTPVSTCIPNLQTACKSSSAARTTRKKNVDESDIENNVFHSSQPLRRSLRTDHADNVEDARKSLEHLLLGTKQAKTGEEKSLTPKRPSKQILRDVLADLKNSSQ